MPGQKSILWTEANDARLLLAIVAVYGVHPDCEKIAAVFGMGISASSIRTRMTKLRQKAKALESATGGQATSQKSTTQRAPAGGKTKNKVGKRAGGILSDDQSDDESVDFKDESDEKQEPSSPGTDTGEKKPNTSTNEMHQKTISGRVTKPRISPRKSSKKDYKALDDPFKALEGAKDTDGEKVFNTDKSDSEDSFPSDADYLKNAKEAAIKMEEAI